MSRLLVLAAALSLVALAAVPTASAVWVRVCLGTDPVSGQVFNTSCATGEGHGECRHNRLWPDCEQICVRTTLDPKAPGTWHADATCVRGTNG